jgi:glycosyltransferase involved in cell wall biosynthesis/predicted TPR repeat methyltransferase
MAKIGVSLTVGLYDKPRFARPWHSQYRPVPPAIDLVDEPTWRAGLKSGAYDVVVAHNELNALDLLDCGLPCILICHNRRSYLETTVDRDLEKGKAQYKKVLERIQDQFSFVFISESKRDDYGLPGAVIPPGIDVSEYGGYTGDIAEVLRVGNSMRARDLMFDVDFQERVCEGIPNRVVGFDPEIPGAKPSDSFDDLLDTYRRLRCLLHVTREDFEDGYNLAMLEAMACGMPVVSLANRMSPLTHGVDGFVSHDADELRACVNRLLDDRDLAHEIGRKGRETVERKFPIGDFVARWRETLEKAADRKAFVSVASGVEPFPGVRMLVEYLCTPLTTGRYIEEALRKDHDVVTAGKQLPAKYLEAWGFSTPPPFVPKPDVTWSVHESFAERLRKVPQPFAPDLYLWVDSGISEIPGDSQELGAPRIAYFIDTQFALDVRIGLARNFDFTFLAQRTHIPDFVHAGIPNVAWLPLACSPELHNVGSMERVYDVAFVGAVSADPLDRRRKILNAIQERFPNVRIGQYWPEDMAQIYAQSKIVVNTCVDRDINMRVFEALASGAMLITDEADGLEELFDDGTHLVIYRKDEDLLGLIEHYLDDVTARKKIAEQGRALVYAKHTYQHRMRQLVLMVLDAVGVLGGCQGESRFCKGGYYRSPRPELAAHVPLHTTRLLDCGCGGGEFGRALKQRGVKEVVGIEVVERAWELAKKALDDALLGSIEDMELPFEDEYFDCVVFGDVLEHLVEPGEALQKVSRVLSKDGVIVMSIPNVRFWQTVDMHVNGRWQYEDAGIMDRTHLRFFCASDMCQMVEQAGLEVLTIQPLSMWPADQLPLDRNRCLKLGKVTIGPLDDAEHQEFLVYQYLVIAAKPGMDRLIGARKALEAQDYQRAFRIAKEARDADVSDRTKIMARAAGKLGQLDTAEKLYVEALRLDPGDAESKGELGIVLLASNRLQEAALLLEDAAKADPNNERIIAGLGLVRLGEGRLDEAFECLSQSLELRSDNASVVQRLIETARALNRLSDAEPYVRRYVDFYAGDIAMACKYAAVLRDIGRADEAMERLDTLLLLAPDHPEVQTLQRDLNG